MQKSLKIALVFYGFEVQVQFWNRVVYEIRQDLYKGCEKTNMYFINEYDKHYKKGIIL